MKTCNRLPAMAVRLVQLRWWLLAGLALAVLLAPSFLQVDLPWLPLLALLMIMAVFNGLTRWRIGQGEAGTGLLLGQFVVDLVGLGVMLYLAGGATNPFVSLLLLPVALAALSLPARRVGVIAGLAVATYTFLMVAAMPLRIEDAERATRLHLWGMWLTFVVSVALLAWFMTRMTAAIRERDRQIAEARENSLRDAQIVALGQLAAGAAHELGTPIGTLKILADELVADTRLPTDAQADLAVMQQQLVLCKEIIGNLSRRAGMERAGDMRAEPADRWLSSLLSRWRTLWPQATCQLEIGTPDGCPTIIVWPILDQAVLNLLNNAARIAPDDLRLVLTSEGETVRIAVQDRGPGFAPAILAGAGGEPLPSHEAGNGLGLWLTRNAVERLGGRLLLANMAGGGGCATIELPLRACLDMETNR